MTVQTAWSAFFFVDRPHPEAAPEWVPLLNRASIWLRRRTDVHNLRELERHMAHDIGIQPAYNPCPAGYLVDPRPLWGIGLTPVPVANAPVILGSLKTDEQTKRSGFSSANS